MKKKWVLYGAIAAVLVVGYAVYAVFFLEKGKIGELCAGNKTCPGECLGFGDLLPDYSHKEVCTKTCCAPSDCPAPTRCEEVNVISSDGKGTQQEMKRYCLPTAGLAN
jgi:hypothetical protein